MDWTGHSGHSWTEERVIQRACSCGAKELIPNHRGRVIGQVDTKPRINARKPKAPKVRVPRVYDRTPEQQARLDEIVRLYTEEHLNYEEIGAKFNLTRERVRQLLNKAGVDIKAEQAYRHTLTRRSQRPLCKTCGNELPSLDEREAGTAEPYIDHVKRLHHRLMNLGRNSSPEVNAQRRAIADDYVAGMKTDDLAAKYGVTATTVTYALLQHGLKRDRRPRANFLKTKPEILARKDAIAADIEAGMRRIDIAAKYQVSDAWVSMVGNERGLDTKTWRTVSPEVKTEIIRLHDIGLKGVQIAKTLRLSPTSVYKVLNDAKG